MHGRPDARRVAGTGGRPTREVPIVVSGSPPGGRLARVARRLLPALAWGLALAGPGTASAATYEVFLTEDASVRPAPPQGGALLLGGGDWPAESMTWFADHAGRGHIVAIAASGGKEDHEEFVAALGPVASVESIVMHDRASGSDPKVLAILRHADGIFIHGGDQSNYVRFWKGTPVAAVIDARFRAGRPLGGTSAGLAILGEWAYGAMDGGSLTSAEALADPLGPAVTLVEDFLHLATLKGVITDTHFAPRGRLGRLIVWVARLHADGHSVTGLGVDEATGIELEADGTGVVVTGRKDGGVTIVSPPRSATIRPGTPFQASGVGLVRVKAGQRIAVAPLRALADAPSTALDIGADAPPPIWP